MKIISWNVNGLRAVMKYGFLDFIDTHKPDILGIQETKLQEYQIPKEIFELKGYHLYWNFAERKGYSGTCLFSKIKPQKVSYGISNDKFSHEGRIIQAEYGEFILFNIYFPNGQMNDDRLKFKLEFYEQLLIHLENLTTSGKNVIIMGDYNTAHKSIDLAHPKANEKRSGFLPIEREWIDKFISCGYVDTFRHFNDSPKMYSWWSYLKNARENNVGWRIDYIFVNKPFITNIKKAFILPDVHGSDHCPVGIEIEI